MDCTDRKYRRFIMDALPNPDQAFKAPLYDDDTFLFNVGLDCVELWAAAERRLIKDCPEPIYERPNITFRPHQVLPEDVLILLPSLVNIRDLLMLGRTCRFFHRQCTVELSRLMATLFASWRLSWISVRFMLAQTNAVLSGFFVYQLLFLGSYCSVDAEVLDIYTTMGQSASCVGRYLEVAGKYERDEEVESPGVGITKTVYYRLSKQHARIAVHHCYEEPRETVFRGQLTCVFSWMCSEGIFVGYPDLTFARKTLVSHSALSLGGGVYDRTVCRKLREVAACHGVDMVPYHRDQDGFCGDIADDFTCPATPRNSFDAMSFRHIFRHQGWKRVLSNTVEPLDVYWVLGAKNCKLNKMGVRLRQKKKNISARPAAHSVGPTHQVEIVQTMKARQSVNESAVLLFEIAVPKAFTLASDSPLHCGRSLPKSGSSQSPSYTPASPATQEILNGVSLSLAQLPIRSTGPTPRPEFERLQRLQPPRKRDHVSAPSSPPPTKVLKITTMPGGQNDVDMPIDFDRFIIGPTSYKPPARGWTKAMIEANHTDEVIEVLDNNPDTCIAVVIISSDFRDRVYGPGAIKSTFVSRQLPDAGLVDIYPPTPKDVVNLWTHPFSTASTRALLLHFIVSPWSPKPPWIFAVYTGLTSLTSPAEFKLAAQARMLTDPKIVDLIKNDHGNIPGDEHQPPFILKDAYRLLLPPISLNPETKKRLQELIMFLSSDSSEDTSFTIRVPKRGIATPWDGGGGSEPMECRECHGIDHYVEDCPIILSNAYRALHGLQIEEPSESNSAIPNSLSNMPPNHVEQEWVTPNRGMWRGRSRGRPGFARSGYGRGDGNRGGYRGGGRGYAPYTYNANNWY
ncbi:hypothetical protein K438DRAFT_1757223 [Mycena galopus ATCC 62051]|nr:hypothetical protein K438DRAFT_1757223 [Mycena galopus ATCC 62051]